MSRGDIAVQIESLERTRKRLHAWWNVVLDQKRLIGPYESPLKEIQVLNLSNTHFVISKLLRLRILVFFSTVHLYERTECINIENHANIVTVPNYEIKRFVWNFIYLESIWSKWWTSKDFKNEANTVISIKCINENLQCYFSLKCFVQSISVYKCLKDDNISILLKIVHMP